MITGFRKLHGASIIALLITGCAVAEEARPCLTLPRDGETEIWAAFMEIADIDSERMPGKIFTGLRREPANVSSSK